jgi:hypothetical protein
MEREKIEDPFNRPALLKLRLHEIQPTEDESTSLIVVEKAPTKPKFSEATIHVGTPFIKCFKYYFDSLNTLRVEDLSKEKFIKIQHDRLDQFFMITESKP